MKANTTPANVANLLTAAAYVRNETIINGNQAAQLDAMTGLIKDLMTKIEAVPAKIADLAAQGKENAVAMWKRMAARYNAQFADAIAEIRAWLVDFKANRPNVQIDLDEPEDHETPNPEPNNTPTTMNANETKSLTASILDELTARKCRGVWDNAVNAYAVELVESLDNWDKQPESVAELREMLLNGANDWNAYSWGGSSLVYNWDIAERLCTPSELRRLTRKDGSLNDSPHGVHLLEHQARALRQAAGRVECIAAKYFAQH